MSRSYHKKVRVGVCGGSNTTYYRSLHRHIRRRNNAHIKDVIKKYDTDEVDDKLEPQKFQCNRWDEPTDGHFVYTKRILNALIEIETDEKFMTWWNKLKRKFKRYDH